MLSTNMTFGVVSNKNKPLHTNYPCTGRGIQLLFLTEIRGHLLLLFFSLQCCTANTGLFVLRYRIPHPDPYHSNITQSVVATKLYFTRCILHSLLKIHRAEWLDRESLWPEFRGLVSPIKLAEVRAHGIQGTVASGWQGSVTGLMEALDRLGILGDSGGLACQVGVGSATASELGLSLTQNNKLIKLIDIWL